jgi:hypothetical protein
VAAGTTYTSLATQTLSSNTATITFSSISQSYTDLVIVVNGGQSVATANAYFQFNNDTTALYSNVYMSGNGTTAVTARVADQNFIRMDYYGWETSLNGNAIINIQNYSNTTTYKTALIRYNTAGYGTSAIVGTWRSTSAINRVDIKSEAYAWLSGSTFTLYGIAAA